MLSHECWMSISLAQTEWTLAAVLHKMNLKKKKICYHLNIQPVISSFVPRVSDRLRHQPDWVCPVTPSVLFHNFSWQLETSHADKPPCASYSDVLWTTAKKKKIPTNSFWTFFFFFKLFRIHRPPQTPPYTPPNGRILPKTILTFLLTFTYPN